MATQETLSHKGFTLLEILLAILILAIGMVSVLWALNTGLFARSDIENVARALNISQAKMEEIKDTASSSVNFNNIISSGPTPDANFPMFNTTVVANSNANIRQVDVTVSWSTKGGNTNIALNTLVTNY